MPNSYDSGSRPLTHVKYQSTNNPYNPDGGYYDHSTGYLPQSSNKRRGTSPWLKFGIPVLIIVIAAAVVGGILGSRSHKNSSSSSSSAAAASSAVANKNNIGVFATATDSYGLPVYPTASNAAYVSPTFVASASAAWPTETFSPSNPQPTSVRSDRPRLIAPKYKWDALPNLVANDPYMKNWNDTIIGNATAWKGAGPVAYAVDGGLTLSGILDVARQVKERVKAYAYAYRVTGDQQWVSQCWDELQNAVGNLSQPFGNNPADRWNSQHFLDLAEFTAAYGIAYDWLYDAWSPDQKSSIVNAILTQGLSYGIAVYTNTSVQNNIGWWSLPNNGKGNWNCVCNSGLTLGALAILEDDTSGTAEQMLGFTVKNALENCATAPTTDGSWTETPNYWYFGTTAHAEMTSSLMTATGSDYKLLSTDENFKDTGLYHMYVTGMTSLFNYADHGPNKYSTTANAMMFYGSQYNIPAYTLFQRDQRDAWSDPWAMFWYDPTVTGAFWDGMPLDHFFGDQLDQWGSMRSTWTSNDGLYVAIKAGQNSGPLHQNHNDLDVGDFVLDAMGQRWFGELGSGDYDAPGYFQGENQDSQRWLYYRKRTEGQNTVVVGGENQLVGSQPSIKHDTTGEKQDQTTTYSVPSSSTAFFTTDMTSAYDQATSMKRGIRLLAGRRQVLLQDEMNTSAGQQWRAHTNASINLDSDTQATLSLGGKTLIAKILSPTSGAKFETLNATRLSTDPTPPAADQDNPGVTVLAVDLPAGTSNLQVLFNPQWDDFTSFVTPPSVAIDSWSLTSHNS